MCNPTKQEQNKTRERKKVNIDEVIQIRRTEIGKSHPFNSRLFNLSKRTSSKYNKRNKTIPTAVC